MRDDRALERYLRFELDQLNAGLVTQRRLLADLLREDAPSAPARGGTHAFDRAELERLAAQVPTELRYTLRLPAQVYVDSEVADAVYAQDRAAIEALRLLGLPLGQPDPQGRAWCSRATALLFARAWPTAVQLVYF